MSVSGGSAGGKVDSSTVDTYDSGDEWDIGVGNLIIDLDADLEKDKLEMSSSKDGAMGAPPSAVAALPDNIKFVSPVSAAQGKESKSKSKRSKNSKEAVKAPVPDGVKKEAQGRSPGEAPITPNTPTKGTDKSKSRTLQPLKKDRDALSGKAKKDKTELVNSDKESLGAQLTVELTGQEQLANMALESGMGPAISMTTEQDEVDNGECRSLKKCEVRDHRLIFGMTP
ncbi:unnamed protein product [Knipowitschia caucasica]